MNTLLNSAIQSTPSTNPEGDSMGRIFTHSESDFGQADAVVIGGGIVGTATAFWLAKSA